tara:strand:+ start:892 stop:1263 length:372 start_codon:yes stop_codon:yes gene_type:complete
MKTLFTIHGGEWLVGEELERRYLDNDITVWVPGSRDRGIDLLVTNNTNKSSVGIQVKFSKSYERTADQFELSPEDIEAGIAKAEAEGEDNSLVTPPKICLPLLRRRGRPGIGICPRHSGWLAD